MKNILKSFSAAAVLAALTVTSMFAAAEVGQAAPDFTLTDVSGKTHKLSDYRGKTVVLEWVNPECPFVKKQYDDSGNMPALQKAAAADGVVWLSINSGKAGAQGDFDPSQVSAWSSKNNTAPAAYFRDSDGTVGKLYGAKTTPHMFVITADGTLVYNGAIDSIKSADAKDIGKATNYVTAALASVKAGQPVEKATTAPYGCSVKY
ncbi:MAG: thioredoxin family protein [Nibricoccus sp.]